MTIQLANHESTASGKPDRIVSLDQFRGYTVVGMLLVNFLGSYQACPQILKHTHDYCSYADTIMPHFLFAVGFGMRLSFGQSKPTGHVTVAYLRMARRLFGLVLLSLVVYTVKQRAASWEDLKAIGLWQALYEPMKRGWFQTLMHIAVTSLWILPVIRCSRFVRIGWMIGSALTHVALSYWFNFEWVNTAPSGIDGGPLGFLTWTIPAIVGTLACDALVSSRFKLNLQSPVLMQVFFAGLLLMVSGYVISCGTRLYDVPASLVESNRQETFAPDPVWPSRERLETKLTDPQLSGSVSDWLAEPPFVRPPSKQLRKWNYWMMSQRSGTLAYLVFSSGFSLFVYLLFFVLTDLAGFELSLFKTFGTNAIAAYVLHMMVSDAVQPFFPKDAPTWFALTGLALYFCVTWMFVRHLEKQRIFLRV